MRWCCCRFRSSVARAKQVPFNEQHSRLAKRTGFAKATLALFADLIIQSTGIHFAQRALISRRGTDFRPIRTCSIRLFGRIMSAASLDATIKIKLAQTKCVERGNSVTQAQARFRCCLYTYTQCSIGNSAPIHNPYTAVRLLGRVKCAAALWSARLALSATICFPSVACWFCAA